jgi:hypothetical protein
MQGIEKREKRELNEMTNEAQPGDAGKIDV